MKKLVFLIILICLIIGIIFGVKALVKNKETSDVSTSRTQNLTVDNPETEVSQKQVEIVQTSVIQENYKPDIIIGDDFYVTQINEMYINFEDYEGKIVEIEGFKLMSGDYTFIGRYGPGCCVDDVYACLEYDYDGELKVNNETDWIKIIGKLTKGNDNGEEYIYLDTLSLEIMTERGIDTVYN